MKEKDIFNKLLSKDPTPGIKNRIIRDNNQFKIPGWVFDSEKDFVFIKLKSINRIMLKHGFSSQILYDILILGLISIDDRPKCLICSKPSKFQNFTRGYYKTCGEKTCISKMSRNEMNIVWKNKAYRDKQSKSHSIWASDLNNIQKMSKNSKKNWENPKYVEKQKLSHKLWFTNPENLEKRRQSQKELWKNEDYRNQQSKSHVKWALENPNKIRNGISGSIESMKSLNKKLNFDSSWEKLFIEICNKLEEIKSIERADFGISYKFEGLDRNYFPDFILIDENNKKYLVEIKANWMIEKDKRTKLKILTGESYIKLKDNDFDRYILLTENDLFSNNHFNEIDETLLKEKLFNQIS